VRSSWFVACGVISGNSDENGNDFIRGMPNC